MVEMCLHFLKNYLKIPYIEAVKMVASMGNVDISEYNLEKPSSTG